MSVAGYTAGQEFPAEAESPSPEDVPTIRHPDLAVQGFTAMAPGLRELERALEDWKAGRLEEGGRC